MAAFAPVSFLIFVLIAGAIVDIRSCRIPNWLTYPAILLGLIYHTVTQQAVGLLFSVTGLGIGIALMIGFYLKGGTGAGDVKLMGAAGAMLGPGGILAAFVYIAFIGGIFALAILIFHGYLKDFVKGYAFFLREFLFHRRWIDPCPIRKKSPRLRYGVAISLGTILSIFWRTIL